MWYVIYFVFFCIMFVVGFIYTKRKSERKHAERQALIEFHGGDADMHTGPHRARRTSVNTIRKLSKTPRAGTTYHDAAIEASKSEDDDVASSVISNVIPMFETEQSHHVHAATSPSLETTETHHSSPSAESPFGGDSYGGHSGHGDGSSGGGFDGGGSHGGHH